MCGRFALKISPKMLAAAFGLDDVPDYSPRYNIAPGQEVAAAANDESGDKRVFRWFQWGLVPGWAKEATTGLINARSETAAAKPVFRDAFRRRRCLIPADGFYEWQKLDSGKLPWFFCRRDDTPLANEIRKTFRPFHNLLGRTTAGQGRLNFSNRQNTLQKTVGNSNQMFIISF